MECSRRNNFSDAGDGEGEPGKGEKNKEVCKNYGGTGQTQLVFSIRCIGYMLWIN